MHLFFSIRGNYFGCDQRKLMHESLQNPKDEIENERKLAEIYLTLLIWIWLISFS